MQIKPMFNQRAGIKLTKREAKILEQAEWLCKTLGSQQHEAADPAGLAAERILEVRQLLGELAPPVSPPLNSEKSEVEKP